ncbi:MAG TPA: hypothetical protein VFZ61_12895, partial [Polyangiales bacterium]
MWRQTGRISRVWTLSLALGCSCRGAERDGGAVQVDPSQSGMDGGTQSVTLDARTPDPHVTGAPPASQPGPAE